MNWLKIRFDDVRKRKTDVVLFWKFDRFARGTKELINALKEFDNLGVNFINYKETTRDLRSQNLLIIKSYKPSNDGLYMILTSDTVEDIVCSLQLFGLISNSTLLWDFQ